MWYEIEKDDLQNAGGLGEVELLPTSANPNPAAHLVACWGSHIVGGDHRDDHFVVMLVMTILILLRKNISRSPKWLP